MTPAQLEARGGKVRCGRCMHAFDGYSELAGGKPEAEDAVLATAVHPTAAADGISSPEPAPTLAEMPDAVQAGSAASAAAPAQDIAPVPEQPPPESAPPQQAIESPAVQEADTVPSQAAIAATAPASASGDRLRVYRTHDDDEQSAGPPLVRKRAHAAWWTAGCIVLMLALASQIAYAYRGDIAARYPALRPALTAFCEAAGCDLTLPQRPDLVKIEASDVHMMDANRPGLIQLTATLRSYASYDLAYPALDLVLTNANEHALVRRIFMPHEYLGISRDPRAGIPPHAEITVALELDTSDLNAAGFRLDLRAAPKL